MTPYGDKELVRHLLMKWMVALGHQYIAWTNVGFLINAILWHSPENNLAGRVPGNALYTEFENYTFKITATSPRGQWVKFQKVNMDRLTSWSHGHMAVISKV